MSDAEQRYAQWLYEATEREKLQLIDKAKSPLCKVIDRVLWVLTFGGQDRFSRDYVTTLGRRIYLPTNWHTRGPIPRLCVMRHELVHVQQFRRYSWPVMVLLYVFFPLPVGFAAGRAWIEWQAYRETLAAIWELEGPEAARSPALHDDIVRRFTGPDYGWMWIHGGTIRRAIRRQLRRLEEGS